MTRSADELVDDARKRIGRVSPADLGSFVERGGLMIDIRPESQREEEGVLDGAIVVERNVLEWRLDPQSSHRLAEVAGYDQPVVVICSQGYASSLAAGALADLGYTRASDLIGGYQAWVQWTDDRWAIP